MGRPILSPFYIGGIEQIIASDKHIQTDFFRRPGTIFHSDPQETEAPTR